MRWKRNAPVILLVAALAALGYGVYRTGRPDPSALSSTTRRGPSDRSISVNQSSLITAERLVRLPTTSDERTFASDALRLADQEMDLAFAQAVRQTASVQRPLSPEAKAIDERLQRATRALAADQEQDTSLTEALAQAKPTEAQAISDRL